MGRRDTVIQFGSWGVKVIFEVFEEHVYLHHLRLRVILIPVVPKPSLVTHDIEVSNSSEMWQRSHMKSVRIA